jgi:DHA1 family bicyclomycin/chloramphenicol resistance-like MFS transporter
MVVLGYLSMAGSLSTDLYLPAFPDMAEDFGVGASAIQLTLTSLLIGAAFGQLTIGSISDALGRRRTLIAGLVVFVACCYLASASPTLDVLILVRTVQGFAGAAGTVLSRAIISDLAERDQALRAFSTLFAMIALGPALANPLGAWLTQLGGWRAALLGLAVLATGMLAAAVFLVPESLPPDQRHPFRLSVLARNVGALLRQRIYMLYAIAFATGYASLLTYLSSSSFIVQDVLGLNPVGYSLTFSLSAVAIMTGSWVTGRLAHILGAARTLALAQALMIAASAVGVLVTSLGALTLTSYLVIICAFAVACGSTMGTASALAVGRSGRTAGTGSALLGFIQYVVGAAAAPLGGIMGTHTALPAMTMMLIFAALALTSTMLAARALAQTPRTIDR